MNGKAATERDRFGGNGGHRRQREPPVRHSRGRSTGGGHGGGTDTGGGHFCGSRNTGGGQFDAKECLLCVWGGGGG